MEDYEPTYEPYNDDDTSYENKYLSDQNHSLSTAMATQAFMDQNEDNLIFYQLETDRMIEKIEHFLRGDEISFDDKGNSFYVPPKDENLKNFNEYGISELMRIISMYVTKETFLSRYDEDRINEILGDLGDALADFIYCNMHKMGMDTKLKQSKFILIVLNILHIVENCYRRALHGAEQENLRKRSIVTQSDSFGGSAQARMMQQRNKFNPLKPKTW